MGFEHNGLLKIKLKLFRRGLFQCVFDEHPSWVAFDSGKTDQLNQLVNLVAFADQALEVELDLLKVTTTEPLAAIAERGFALFGFGGVLGVIDDLMHGFPLGPGGFRPPSRLVD